MEQRTLSAKLRTATGKGVAKALRKAARLPAVMNDGTGKAVLLDIDAKEFNKLFQSITESTLVSVMVDGTEHVSFVKDVQYDIISDTIRHVDFYQVEPGKVLRTKIRIKITGSPEGVRLGGVLEYGINEIDVECLPKNLPERVVLDVSDLQLNHSLHVRDLKLPEGVKVHTDGEISVVTLKYTKNDIPAAAETAAPAPAAAK
ncbi:MAG TPA: 50S ribosomal protein L25 [Treponemataceae bacterium]|jgi:large subunit ribosomal protein L25|nr:MAG: 50S ribosomal protein L25 [Spirochaetes bacterium ADurb.Bin269]TAH48368.1 MAG: 50S ribosomal protein L25 [Treponema sp.]HOC29029.1 50S ribosomal protein L25 [Treponemataceae bacterium]HQL33231.1 50S ribosomal protein L25 [Treponemataceae bacterium]